MQQTADRSLRELQCEHTGFSCIVHGALAAIYKVLPDTPIAWRDVRTGAFLTALMFTARKSLIGWYLGTTATSSGNGAAGPDRDPALDLLLRAIIPVRIRGDQSNRRCAVG